MLRRRFLLGGMLAILAIVLLLTLVVISPRVARPAVEPLRAILLQATMSWISASINGELEIGGLQGSLLRDPALQDVVLRDAAGTVIGRIASVRLDYAFKALFQGRLHIRNLEVDNPQLTLSETPDKGLNIDHALSPASPSKEDKDEKTDLPLAIYVDRITLESGRLALQLASLAGVRSVQDISLMLRGQIDRQGVRLELQRLTAFAQPADVRIESAGGGFLMHSGDMRFESLSLHTAATRITLDGALPVGSGMADLRLALRPLSVSEVGRLLADETLQGDLRLEMSAVGPGEAIEVSGRLEAGGGRMQLQGSVDAEARPPRYKAELGTTGLDMAAVIARPELCSDINARVSLEGEGLGPGELQGVLRLDIDDSHLGDIALHPSRVHLQAGEQKLRIDAFDIDTSIARMTAQGGLDLRGASNLQYHLSAKLSGLRRLFEIERLEGALELQGKALGVWPDLEVQGHISAENLHFDDYGAEVLGVDYTAHRLGSEPFLDSRWEGSGLNIDNFDVEHAIVEADYDVGSKTLSLDTRLRQSEKYQGQARGNLFFEDAGQRLSVEKLALQLEERPWTVLGPAQIRWGAGLIDFYQVRLAHAEELIELSGGIRDRHFRDLMLQTRNLDLEFLKRMFKLPDTVSGRADLDARLQGSLDAPGFEGALEVTDIPEQHLPFARVGLALNYGRRELEGRLALNQKDAEVLSLVVQQPLDLALTDIPLEQRLLPGPISARLALKRLDVSPFQASSDELAELLLSIQTALQDLLVIQPEQFVVLPANFPDFPDLPDLPEIEGPLQGYVDGQLELSGTYAEFGVNAEMRVQDLGIENAIDQIHAPMTMTAKVEMAASLEELKQALAEERLAPAVSHLRLHTPAIEGRLPVQGTDGRLEIRDLLLQAEAALRRDGLVAELQNFRTQVRVPKLPVTDLALVASLSPKGLTLTRLRVATPHSKITAGGSIKLPGQELSLAVDIAPLMLDEILPELVSDLPARVEGSVELKGTIQTPRAEARLNYASANIEGELDARLAQATPDYSVQLRIDSLDVARFAPDLTGVFGVTARLQGAGFSDQDRRARLNLVAGSEDFKLAPGFDLSVIGDVKGADIVVEEFVLSSETVKVMVQGLVSSGDQTALIYNLDLGDLAPVQEYLGVNLQAEGALSGEFRGTMEDLRTQGTLYLNNLSYTELRCENLLGKFEATDLLSSLSAKLDLQLVGLQAPTLARSSMQLTGGYRGGRGDFSLAISEGPFKETMLEGNLVREAGYQLRLNRVNLHRGEWSWRNVAPVALDYDERGGLVLERLHLQNEEQIIMAHGKLSPEGQVSGLVDIDNMQVRPLIQSFLPELNFPYGRLSLDLELNGTLQRPAVSSSMRIAGLKLRGEPLGDIGAELNSSGTVYKSDFRWTLQSVDLVRMQGSVDTEADGNIDMQLKSAGFDLARLSSMSNTIVKSAGRLAVDLRIEGNLRQPQAFGEIAVQEGQLQLLATGEPYTDIRSLLRFTGTRVEIEDFHVGSTTGKVVLDGWMEIAGYEVNRVEMKLDANDFRAMRTPAIDARVNADLALRGSQRDMKATGKVTVPQARIRIDNLPTSEAVDVEPWQLTVPGVYGPGPDKDVHSSGKARKRKEKAPLPFLRADIDVDFPRNVWVQGQGTAVELYGDLGVKKELQGPFVLGGYVDTLRGFASFLGKKFEIEKGRVDFTGAEDIDPVLDITAKQNLSDYVVYVDVTGRSKKPDLNFRSEPELEEADIISLLVFGKTTDRLSSSEQNNLSSKAGQLAGSVAAGILENVLGDAFGLDSIAIDPGDDESAQSFGVGRYITQDVYLSYDRIIRDPKKDNRGGNTVGLEYSLNRNFKIKASSSDIGETALDFSWTVDY